MFFHICLCRVVSENYLKEDLFKTSFIYTVPVEKVITSQLHYIRCMLDSCFIDTTSNTSP